MEKDRLVNRSTQTPRDRATNDMRVRKKLSTWAKDIPEVLSILKYLPEDQKRDIIKDEDVFALLNVTERLLAIKEFHSIYGEFRDPANWKITETCGDSRRYRCDSRSLQPAGDIDILRSLFLSEHLETIQGFLGCNNPVAQYALAEQLDTDLGWRDHIKDGDRAGMDRIRQALKNIPDYLGHQRPAPKKIDLNYIAESIKPL